MRRTAVVAGVLCLAATLAAQTPGVDRLETLEGRGRARRMFLELRLAENEPVRGLTIEGTVKGSGAKAYVHFAVLAGNGDVQKAAMVESNGRYSVVLTMTPEGAGKMADATAKHKGRPIAVILDGEITALVPVRATLRDEIVILDQLNRDEASRISSALVW